MNWYLEMELHHGTAEWDILKERFLLTFKFEDSFTSIDEALQEIKVVIFRMPTKPMEWTQLDWSTHLRHALECDNVIIEDEYEDTWRINIPEVEGHRKVKGTQLKNPDISVPLKTKQVKLDIKEELNFVMIGDYWDDATMHKVFELLCEYQVLLPTKFLDLKGIVGDFGIMKITLKSNVKPIK